MKWRRQDTAKLGVEALAGLQVGCRVSSPGPLATSTLKVLLDPLALPPGFPWAPQLLLSPLFLYPRGLCLVTPSPTLLSPEQQLSPPAQLSPSPPLSVTLLLFIVFTNPAAGSALKEMAQR